MSRPPRPETGPLAGRVIRSALTLRSALRGLGFGAPVTHTYNPLDYAWEPHRTYLRRFANSRKKALFLGMNPGPYGMMQTGVPFGEVSAVRDWMGICDPVSPPAGQHPRRPIEGFKCGRSEVSGRRLWGLFAARYPDPEAFFRDHLVVNYCPLVFLEETGRNHTPDKLPAEELKAVYLACDRHLRDLVSLLQPEHVIGVGAFAAKRAALVLEQTPIRVGQILHPSPASPAANRDWAGTAARQLQSGGLWP